MKAPNLNLASNMFGPLDGELRARLAAFLENPTTDTWNEAYSIILNARDEAPGIGLGLTLWKAVLAVDPAFAAVRAPVTRWVEDDSDLGGHSEPVSDWTGIPTREVAIQAINYAIN